MTPSRRWIAGLMIVVALGLGPWTLYLTYTLPARHVTRHWDLAWVGFDIVLAASFALTGWCAYRATKWLAPSAAVTGTMLLCDAWFDVVTSTGPGEQFEALLEAGLAELPLAALCAYIVWDTERFTSSLPVRRWRRERLEEPEPVLELRDP